jgi:hypothetical protein
MSHRCLFILLLSFPATLLAQSKINRFLTPASAYSSKRTTFIATTGVVTYSAALVGLNSLWYSNYPRSGFHFFNDAAEWKQVDKLGHLWTSYSIGRAGIEMMQWAGVKEKKAIWIGGSLGSVFLTTIEILDGFSAEWGASPADLLANTSGTLLVLGQELAWKEQRILLKFSFHPAYYPVQARSRADELYGSSFMEKLFKDYNGQAYWLSVNPTSFMKSGSRFPKWLNIAVGYGAGGMLGGFDNLVERKDGTIEDFTFIPRYRQYYLSVDVDFSRIKTRSPLVKTLLTIANAIKIPAPALEYNGLGKFRFHPVYF